MTKPKTYCQVSKKFRNKKKIVRCAGCYIPVSVDNLILRLCPDCYIEAHQKEEMEKWKKYKKE